LIVLINLIYTQLEFRIKAEDDDVSEGDFDLAACELSCSRTDQVHKALIASGNVRALQVYCDKEAHMIYRRQRHTMDTTDTDTQQVASV
jgi:hypothetical protein